MAIIKKADEKKDITTYGGGLPLKKTEGPTLSDTLKNGLADKIGGAVGGIADTAKAAAQYASSYVPTPITASGSYTPSGFGFRPYTESADVANAHNAMLAHNQNRVADWTGGTYGVALQQAMDKIANREKFSYDLNGDALYQQYRDRYINQGRLAMQDTIGQASGLTGGYGNSYAMTAGNQAYQGYLQGLNDIVPELYQLAYDKYNQEGQDLLNQYGMYADAYAQEYGQHRDSVADWNTEANRLANDYYNAYNMDYGRYSDDFSRALQAHKEGVSEKQYASDLALQYAKLNADALKQRVSALASSVKGTATGSAEGTEAPVSAEVTQARKQYAGWDASDWEKYFATIRQEEGVEAAQMELQEFTRLGYIPDNMTSYASIGARGRTGH